MLPDKLRAFLYPFVPKSLLKLRKERKWRAIREQYGSLSVPDAFSEVYRTKLWGAVDDGEFFSGEGSTEFYAVPYSRVVTGLIREHHIRTVLDLGCGDFRVGKRICSEVRVHYTGVDIVPDLIAYNKSHFGREGIDFRCANIIADELPDADLCLIRQVLQHLSNAQISQVLKKLAKYPYVLVTEDVFSGRGLRPNLDHIHGPDNRLHKRSGVFLDLPPYNLNTQVVLEVPCTESNSIFRTVLIKNTAEPSRRYPQSSNADSRSR